MRFSLSSYCCCCVAVTKTKQKMCTQKRTKYLSTEKVPTINLNAFSDRSTNCSCCCLNMEKIKKNLMETKQEFKNM